MNYGRVYIWFQDSSNQDSGHIRKEIVPLLRLDTEGEGKGRLWGRYVRVRNGGEVNEPDLTTGRVQAVSIGEAMPNSRGDFLFEPGRGGGRMDKVTLAEPDFRWRYVQASHFGEVNTYYHIDRIAAYIDELLQEFGVSSLPRITAVVNAHHAATEKNGLRDGLRREERWLPFQGGHYRLPGRTFEVAELEPLAPEGEIHLGPGRSLQPHGALATLAGHAYRANASHNAGIIYHEYGHHITRHTADFRANALSKPDQQSNRKTALDEGVCDYWAASMLGTPHIWALHHRHDGHEVHRRSLVSLNTMADYNHGKGADTHLNGTIWASALWDLRSQLAVVEPKGARVSDLLVLQSLLRIGRMVGNVLPATKKNVRQARDGFAVGLNALLQADSLLYKGRHHELIVTTFAKRGILSDSQKEKVMTSIPVPEDHTPRAGSLADRSTVSSPKQGLLQSIDPADVPETSDLFSGEELEVHMDVLGEPSLSIAAVGDIMLGGRTKNVIRQHGGEYPLHAVLPLLRRATIVLGNLEGPFVKHTKKEARNFSYRVNPKLAFSMSRAGINVVTLANNHLLDCGRAGVLETLEVLADAGIAPIGAGVNEKAAHAPRIIQVGPYRVGLLGFYWNRRTAAREKLPGSAMDTPAELQTDIRALRSQVDRLVVTFHWGIPYLRKPSAEDCAKARFAVDCGADFVVGHHPHIIQPFEIYRGCPIFYSVGNFAFGSGNSRAEGLLVGCRFEKNETVLYVYPLYVKNRDPRVDYQPKFLKGESATRILRQLAEMSGSSGQLLQIEFARGKLVLPWQLGNRA